MKPFGYWATRLAGNDVITSVVPPLVEPPDVLTDKLLVGRFSMKFQLESLTATTRSPGAVGNPVPVKVIVEQAPITVGSPVSVIAVSEASGLVTAAFTA